MSTEALKRVVKRKATTASASASTSASATGPVPATANPEIADATCEFDTHSGDDFWFSLSKNEFGPLQPLHELIDNAIAAILAAFVASAVNLIHIDMDFEKQVGTIEHVGGQTFPTNAKELSRCFTYGGRSPTSLNEHGCGLKTSLAILDPENRNWVIYIKKSATDMYAVKAPYSNKMSLYPIKEWPGRSKGGDCGAIVQFPIKQQRFKSLYSTKEPKMSDLNLRIQCELSHMWMMQEEISRGAVKMFYNGTQVTPFNFRIDEVHERVASVPLAKTAYPCSTGATLELEQICLKETAKTLPGSHWFKYAQTTNGIYLFKNGRFIEKIGDGRFYEFIMGGAPHHDHNSNIILANMKGSQEQLPVTSTTKNSFLKTTAAFEEVIDLIAKHIVKPARSKHRSEETTIQDYKRRQEATFKAVGVHATIEVEKSYPIADAVQSPPIDLVMELNNVLRVYEGKDIPRLQVSTIAQLFTNFLCAKKANPGKVVKPILLLNAKDVADATVTEQHKAILQLFRDSESDFDVTIQNYKNEVIYPKAADE